MTSVDGQDESPSGKLCPEPCAPFPHPLHATFSEQFKVSPTVRMQTDFPASHVAPLCAEASGTHPLPFQETVYLSHF